MLKWAGLGKIKANIKNKSEASRTETTTQSSISSWKLPDTLRGHLVNNGGASQTGLRKSSTFDLESFGEVLGQGNYGTVKLRVDRNTGEARAVKVVVKPDHWDRARLIHEAEVMKNLDHPYILRIFGWHDEESSMTMVTEYCGGGELINAVRKATNAWTNAVHQGWAAMVFRQLFEAINYCHERGLIHRDIKSGNILLYRAPEADSALFKTRPHVVVADLGLATVFNQKEQQKNAGGFGFARKSKVPEQRGAGTTAMMAPEVWKGCSGPKSDMWSLGCVLYQVFTAQLPFMPADPEDDTQATWTKLYKEDADWILMLHASSEEARDLCKELLTVDVRLRPAAKECLRNSWFSRFLTSCPQGDPSYSVDWQSLAQTITRWPMITNLTKALRLKMAYLSAGTVKFAEMFTKMDADSNGVLTSDEFVETLRELQVSEGIASKIADSLDYNGDGCVEYLEFAAAVLPALGEEYDRLVWQEFCQLDTAGKGELTYSMYNKLIETVRPVGLPRGGRGSDGHVEAVLHPTFEEIDLDKDGKIIFPEFLAAFGRPGVDYSAWITEMQEEKTEQDQAQAREVAQVKAQAEAAVAALGGSNAGSVGVRPPGQSRPSNSARTAKRRQSSNDKGRRSTRPKEKASSAASGPDHLDAGAGNGQRAAATNGRGMEAVDSSMEPAPPALAELPRAPLPNGKSAPPEPRQEPRQESRQETKPLVPSLPMEGEEEALPWMPSSARPNFEYRKERLTKALATEAVVSLRPADGDGIYCPDGFAVQVLPPPQKGEPSLVEAVYHPVQDWQFEPPVLPPPPMPVFEPVPQQMRANPGQTTPASDLSCLTVPKPGLSSQQLPSAPSPQDTDATSDFTAAGFPWQERTSMKPVESRTASVNGSYAGSVGSGSEDRGDRELSGECSDDVEISERELSVSGSDYDKDQDFIQPRPGGSTAKPSTKASTLKPSAVGHKGSTAPKPKSPDGNKKVAGSENGTKAKARAKSSRKPPTDDGKARSSMVTEDGDAKDLQKRGSMITNGGEEKQEPRTSMVTKAAAKAKGTPKASLRKPEEDAVGPEKLTVMSFNAEENQIALKRAVARLNELDRNNVAESNVNSFGTKKEDSSKNEKKGGFFGRLKNAAASAAASATSITKMEKSGRESFSTFLSSVGRLSNQNSDVEVRPLIVFDWDDTITSTFHIQTSVLASLPQHLRNMQVTRAYHEFPQFQRHAAVVEAVLRCAKTFAHVSILTLCEPAWLNASIERYFPEVDVATLLTSLDIQAYHADRESAPVKAQASMGADPSLVAKKVMFSRCLRDFYGADDVRWNVMSIGDSNVEHDALKSVIQQEALSENSRLCGSPLCKTVKFPDNPSLTELTASLSEFMPCIQAMVDCDRSFHHIL